MKWDPGAQSNLWASLTARVRWPCPQCGEPYFESREVELIQKALVGLDRESSALVAAGPSPSKS